MFVSKDGEQIGEATVDGTDWAYTVDPPLKNGTYVFSATQIDQAGNVSELSDPSCELRVATTVGATGGKLVEPVANPAAGIAEVAADNWEITLSDGAETWVMGAQEQVLLKRDTKYTVGERLRSDPEPQAGASRYLQLGQLACEDAEGKQLPDGVLDPGASTLIIGAEVDLAEPIWCAVSNQAAQASFVTLRLGGQTLLPLDGWGLGITSPQTGDVTALDADTPSAIMRPGEGEISGTVPEGLSLIGVQRLDHGRAECADEASNPTSVPPECWIQLSEGEASVATIPQGVHSVYRLVAAAPADLPKLPLTGGIGSWVYTAGGAAALALASAAYLWRRQLLKPAATKEGRGH